MKQLLYPLEDLWYLLFPQVCLICETQTPLPAKVICFKCFSDLPFTNHHQVPENDFKLRFVGRVNVDSAQALYYFSRGGLVQKIIHAIKYDGNADLAKELGLSIGKRLIEQKEELKVDYLVPVPIHHRKKSIRGYNQAELIARGISEVVGIEVLDKLLIKSYDHESQTKKSRTERFKNVLSSFKIRKGRRINGKHILIIDDVCTTGATLEACTMKIQEEYKCNFSFAIAAIAV